MAAASEETIATEVNYEQSLYVHYYQTSLNVDTLANVQSLYRTCFACIDPAIVCFSFFPDFFALQNYVSCCMESLHFSFVNSNQNRFHFGELKLVLNGRVKRFLFHAFCMISNMYWNLKVVELHTLRVMLLPGGRGCCVQERALNDSRVDSPYWL